jgi:uncharacterized protein YodC (DUF2158 family)
MTEVVSIVSKKTPSEPIRPERFKRGQVVQLKSKGTPMTILKVALNQITCDWHLSDGQPVQCVYHADQLELCSDIPEEQSSE